MNTKAKTRFIRSIVAEAAKTDVQLPWSRGQRRVAFVAKRQMAADRRKTA